MPRFAGVQVAIVTPFDSDGEVNYERLREHTNWLVEQGVHGIVTTGSCGEFATLTQPERQQAVETVVESVAGRIPVTVGVAAPSTSQVIAWTRHARGIGADAVMALPPLDYHPTHSEIVEYYKAISDIGLPIAAYNNPVSYGTDLTPDFLQELARIENFVAVKEFSGDVRRIAEIAERTDLEVVAGVDDLALESLMMGATGWIAGLANALPSESVKLYQLATSGRLDEARTLYASLLPLFRYDSTPLLVQAIKYAMELVGQPVGDTRPPRLALDEQIKSEVKRALETADAHRAETVL